MASSPPPVTPRRALLERLSSRKFLLTVAAALTIVIAWAKGALRPEVAAAVVMVLTVAYTLVEGYIDASP